MTAFAKRRFGQNFLTDQHYIGRIIDVISPKPGQTLVEVGPGRGALTGHLIERAGCINAIEIDRDMAAVLQQRFTPEQLVLTQADALEVDYAQFVSEGADQPSVRLVGNLPYNISSPLLFTFARFSDVIIDQHFMLQKEVVERMVAQPGTAQYGRLSVALQVRYRMAKLMIVPPGAFVPAPQVDSAIVRMVPRRDASAFDPPVNSWAMFDQVITTAFGQRRKMLRNTMAAFTSKVPLEQAQIEPTARAEEIEPAGFVRYANLLAASG